VRTRLAALLASLVIVATGVVVAPGRSYAGGGTDEARTFKTSPTTDVGYLARVSPDWKLGDCTLFDTVDRGSSTVKITMPEQFDLATVIWHGVGRTTKTTNGDIWWVKFHFRTAFGTEIATTPRLRGQTMTTINRTYVWEVSVVINFDGELFPNIFEVDWESTC
jgi:hypothetical protein